jgi:uncharacterized membrane protein YfcA
MSLSSSVPNTLPSCAKRARAEVAAIPIGPIELGLAVLVMIVACAIQGAVGFGAGLIAAPLLLLIHPGFAPGPVLVANLALTILVTRREWSHIDVPGLKLTLAGRIAGTLLAMLLLASVSQTVFDLIFGSMVLAAVGLSLRRGTIQRTARVLTTAGLASGIMSTLSSIGGPPVALVYQGAEPSVFRATLGANLLVGAGFSIAALALVGRFGGAELIFSAVLVPCAVVGYWLSHMGLDWLDAGRVRVAVLLLSSLGGVGVLGRAIHAAAQ